MHMGTRTTVLTSHSIVCKEEGRRLMRPAGSTLPLRFRPGCVGSFGSFSRQPLNELCLCGASFNLSPQGSARNELGSCVFPAASSPHGRPTDHGCASD